MFRIESAPVAGIASVDISINRDDNLILSDHLRSWSDDGVGIYGWGFDLEFMYAKEASAPGCSGGEFDDERE